MIVIAAILTFLVVSFINSSFSYRASTQAMAIASAGVEDAMLRLIRNKDFSSASYCVPDSSCGSTDATVSVTQNSPVSGFATIVSSARVSRRERKIKATVSVASSTGEVAIVKWDLLIQ